MKQSRIGVERFIWTPQLRAKLRKLKVEGLSRKVIAERLGCLVATCDDEWKRLSTMAQLEAQAGG